jgi:hypothetical protein
MPMLSCEPETQDPVGVREEIRGYSTSLPPGRQIYDASQSGSIPDSALVTSSSGQTFVDEQLAQVVPRYPFQQAGWQPQTTLSEGQDGNNQNDWRSSGVAGYGSSPQYQSERWTSPRPPYLAHSGSSLSTPNMYFSTSQLRDERDQSNGQARQVEQAYAYNRANEWPSAVNPHDPSSENLALPPTFPSAHNPWLSSESTFAQSRQPNNQSRSTGQIFIPGPQMYTGDAHSNEQQYRVDEK